MPHLPTPHTSLAAPPPVPHPVCNIPLPTIWPTVRENNAPKLGVRYPHNRKSLKTNHASSDMLALTFSLIRQKAKLPNLAVLRLPIECTNICESLPEKNGCRQTLRFHILDKIARAICTPASRVWGASKWRGGWCGRGAGRVLEQTIKHIISSISKHPSITRRD